MLVIGPRLKIPLREFQFTWVRSSGPGGQNVNKVATKATLRWPILQSPTLPRAVRDRFLAKYRRRVTAQGDVVISSQRFRDAGRNVADCLEKLRNMLAEVAAPPKPRRPTKPTRASVRRRLDRKRKHSRKKESRRKPVDD